MVISPDVSLLLNTNVPVSSMVLTSTQLRQALAQPSAQKIIKQYNPDHSSLEENDLGVRAISRVIAESQRRIYGINASSTKYKDRVRRALVGQSVTPDTVHLFADAFEFDQQTVNQLLSQLSHENALSSTALTYLHEFPQAAVNHVFIDVSQTDHNTTELSINGTIASLELGSSSFILLIPHTLGVAYNVEGCTATKVSDEGYWLLELEEPLLPLSHALISMSFEIDTECADGTHWMLLPFWSKYNAVALRVDSGSASTPVTVESRKMGSTETENILDGTHNKGIFSTFFPLVENETLKISW